MTFYRSHLPWRNHANGTTHSVLSTSVTLWVWMLISVYMKILSTELEVYLFAIRCWLMMLIGSLKATNANIFYADSKYCCRYYVWLPWPFRKGHRERKADTEKLPERKCPEVTSAEPEEEEILDPINEELERATKLLEKVHKVRRGVRDNVSTSFNNFDDWCVSLWLSEAGNIPGGGGFIQKAVKSK